MKTQTSISRSYYDYLISSLKEIEEATTYLETFLELDKEGREPKILRGALKDIIGARLLANNLSERARESDQELDKLLS